MNLVPEHRALLGVDVVSSASNPGYHLNAVPKAVRQLVSEALRKSGIDLSEVLEWEGTGDGALVTLPSRNLGAVLDSANHLDVLASERNKWEKPELRLRIAVEEGPVGDGTEFDAAKITLSRLLDATEFKDLFTRCRAEGQDGPHTALIVSEPAVRTAYSGDHTKLRRDDFAQLSVRNKEYTDSAWVRVPGFDTRSLTAFAEPKAAETAPSQSGQVSNVVYGDQKGLQAHTIHGDVTFGK